MNSKANNAVKAVVSWIFVFTLSTSVCLSPAKADGQSKVVSSAYVKADAWPQTMLASRAQLETHLAEQEQLTESVKLGPWYVTAPIEVRGFSDAMFPEKQVDLDTKDHHGRSLWSRQPDLTDGSIHSLHSTSPASTYLFRVITTDNARILVAGFGSNDGLEVWLNGKKLLSEDIGRQAAPDQNRVTLSLAAGENRLLAKVFNRANVCEFYFLLRPDPRFELWSQMEADFPVEAGWMKHDCSEEELMGWFSNADNVKLEHKIIREALSEVHPDGKELEGQFEALRSAQASPDDPRWLSLFIKVCERKRGAFLRRCPPVAFIKRPARGRKGTNATMLGQRTKVGSSICIYDPADPHAGVKTIFESKKGFIFDMSASYDVKKLVFSFMEDIRQEKGSFHIWQINIDGTGLRQLTSGPYHDGSPVYLPDGKIVFCSTRVESFSVCQDFLAAALYIVDADGGNLRRLEYNTLCDTTPYVMDDGSILFGRWEYQDKNIFCVQGLWTINPDGTRVQLFYGNTLTIPNSIYGAKQIPGTRKVVCVMAPHHGRPLGAIGILDRSIGLENTEALVNITPEIPYFSRHGDNWHDPPNNSWGPGDQQYDWAFGDPYPIAEDLFVVAYGGPREGGPQRYRLYLLDDRGYKVKLYEDPAISCYCPLPLVARPLPHKMPGTIPEPKGEGTFFVADIYQGLLDKGVKRGQIKALRIMSQIPKKYNTEGPRYHDHYPVMGHGSYYAKYCYGTVPVYEDGLAYFKAPAGVELYFIAIDADGKEIRRMGTVTQITAGERQGCVGCHESRFTAAPRGVNVMKRLARKPDAITPPPWGAGFVDQVQPILDKYCVSCHSGRTPKARMDLSGGKTRFYNMAYRSLVDRNLVEYYYIHDAPTGNFQPLASGSWVSKLTKIIESEHMGVKMDDRSRRRIFSWIDGNAPYYGMWDMSRPYTQGGRDTWHRLRDGKRGQIEPEPWFADFKKAFEPACSSCHGVKFDWINLTSPQYSRVLNAHLAKEAGGMGLAEDKDGQKPPVFETTDDLTYQALLKAIQAGKQTLYAKPRMDMPGGIAIAQQRNFGKLY
jgi:hypothetical protein